MNKTQINEKIKSRYFISTQKCGQLSNDKNSYKCLEKVPEKPLEKIIVEFKGVRS